MITTNRSPQQSRKQLRFIVVAITLTLLLLGTYWNLTQDSEVHYELARDHNHDQFDAQYINADNRESIVPINHDNGHGHIDADHDAIVLEHIKKQPVFQDHKQRSSGVLERQDDDDYGMVEEDFAADPTPLPPQLPEAPKQESVLILYYMPVSGFLGQHMLVCCMATGAQVTHWCCWKRRSRFPY
jgi:hypothetical protein